jgi:hypothetical protein
MSTGDLEKALGMGSVTDPPLSFDPTTSRYFGLVEARLQLTDDEKSILRKQGVVSIDSLEHFGMLTAYVSIYRRDLPVLVTTDSILHALHRSYDEMLKEIEVELFTDTIKQSLEATLGALSKRYRTYKDDQVRDSARDLDVYLSVALNLLAGGGSPDSGATVVVHSKLDDDRRVEEQLVNVISLGPRSTTLNGTTLEVDYSQFKPRGHYTESEELKRYFRTLMWLGRADLGFVLKPAEPGSGIEANADRGLRDAALMTLLVREAGVGPRLRAMSSVVDFLVGRADNLRLEQMDDALAKSELGDPGKLADSAMLARLRSALAGQGEQQIRSQPLQGRHEGPEMPLPDVFQLFGQRFVIDSFVLSKVVFDSIDYHGAKPNRQMPSGRDVMAALGNDDAVRLLEPELQQYQYSTNLLSARRVVESYPKEEWASSVYGLWLDALRTLDDPPDPGFFPQVMRREAWRKKHLETQLASWAELRHDTILYAKQSYASIACEYPAGYVEPYPAFFERLDTLAREAAHRLAVMDVSFGGDLETKARSLRDGYVAFYERFGKTMRYLRWLARKELAGKPFTAEETTFLKKIVTTQVVGCGTLEYNGWYPNLFYEHYPEHPKPTVADVHTSIEAGKVLEEGVGDANLLVVAIDNGNDRAVYVGPAYSYYEFTAPLNDRFTDDAWRTLIAENNLPPRPAWTSVFRTKAVPRKPQRPPEP